MSLFKQIFTCLLLALSLNAVAQTHQKLVFAIDVVRHGDRTPTRIIPIAPHYWKEGLGQLTPKGMQQIFQLGETIRKKYINDYHLLPPQFHPDSFQIISTDVPRTLTSAQAFILGLYPLGTGPMFDPKQSALPSGFQPIPIRHLKRKMTHPKSNSKYEALLEKHVYSKKEWREKNASLSKYYPGWSKATGIKITHLSQLVGLGDTLFVYRLYHIDLPEGLTEQDASMIIDAGIWAMAAKYKPKVIGDYLVHKLVALIGEHIKQASNSNSHLKYIFVSAHDGTILSLLSALESPLDTKPSYASDLNFSLYENGDDNYQVEITFNGKPLYIPACGGRVCSLNAFMSLVE